MNAVCLIIQIIDENIRMSRADDESKGKLFQTTLPQ